MFESGSDFALKFWHKWRFLFSFYFEDMSQAVDVVVVAKELRVRENT